MSKKWIFFWGSVRCSFTCLEGLRFFGLGVCIECFWSFINNGIEMVHLEDWYFQNECWDSQPFMDGWGWIFGYPLLQFDSSRIYSLLHHHDLLYPILDVKWVPYDSKNKGLNYFILRAPFKFSIICMYLLGWFVTGDLIQGPLGQEWDFICFSSILHCYEIMKNILKDY